MARIDLALDAAEQHRLALMAAARGLAPESVVTEWVRERLALAAPPEDAAGRRERGLAALDALAALAARRPPPDPARFERLMLEARAERDARPRMGAGDEDA